MVMVLDNKCHIDIWCYMGFAGLDCFMGIHQLPFIFTTTRKANLVHFYVKGMFLICERGK